MKQQHQPQSRGKESDSIHSSVGAADTHATTTSFGLQAGDGVEDALNWLQGGARQREQRDDPDKCHAPPPATPSSSFLRSVVDDLPPAFHRVYMSRFAYFNAVQSESFATTFGDDRNAIIAAPTGAGKTVCLELALLRLLSSQLADRAGSHFNPPRGNLKAVYLAPTRSLVGEQARSWRASFGDKLGLVIEELTVVDQHLEDGPRSPLIPRLARADIILATPERWDSITRHRRDFAGLFASIGLLLIDEVHLLGERKRGPALEVAIARMRAVAAMPAVRGQPVARLRCVAVSATIGNIMDVASWLGSGDDANASAIAHDFGPEYRPCPLTMHVHGAPFWKNDFLFERSLDTQLVSLITKYGTPGKPVLIFNASRRGCVSAAENIAQVAASLFASCSSATAGGGANAATTAAAAAAAAGTASRRTGGGGRRPDGSSGIGARSSAVPTFAPAVRGALQDAARQVTDKKLANLLTRGVGFHYARGMADGDRNVVESIFRAGLLPCLCCTTTLALGVNLPASLVIIKGTERYESDSSTYEPYATSEILQMAGRAGRPGFDTSGTAVVLTKDTATDGYRNLLQGGEALESSLHSALAEHLNAEAHLGTVGSLSDAAFWVRKTFLAVRSSVNPREYFVQRELRCGAKPEVLLDRLVRRSVERLVASGLVKSREGGPNALHAFASTEAGRLAAKFCVRIETAEHLLRSIRPHACLPDILRALVSSREVIDVCPLRRNEKKDLNTYHNDTLACFFCVTEHMQWTTAQEQQQQAALPGATSATPSGGAAATSAAAAAQGGDGKDEDEGAAPPPTSASRDKATKILRTSADKAQVLVNHALSWKPRVMTDASMRQESDAILALADRLLTFAFEACVAGHPRFAYAANAYLLRRACALRMWHRPAAACLTPRGALGPRSPAGGAAAPAAIAEFLASSAPECRQLPGIGPKLSAALVEAGFGPLDRLLAANPRDIDAACNKAYPFGYRLQAEARRRMPSPCRLIVRQEEGSSSRTPDVCEGGGTVPMKLIVEVVEQPAAPNMDNDVEEEGRENTIHNTSGGGTGSAQAGYNCHALLIVGHPETDALLLHERITLSSNRLPHRAHITWNAASDARPADVVAALLPERVVSAAGDVYATCALAPKKVAEKEEIQTEEEENKEGAPATKKTRCA